jgi:toxoflavin biosynthesis protein ToxC
MSHTMLHQGPIAGIASHGNLIATAGYDNRIILWKGRRGIACATHDHLVNQCAFSSDGRWLVSASSDYSARVWEVPTLRLKAVLSGHGDDVDMAVFSPDDRRIATCALDRCVRIFDLDGRCLSEMRGHTGNVLSLAWTSDGRHVVSSSVDGTIRRWDTERQIEIERTDLEVRSDSIEIAPGMMYAGDDRGRIALIEGGQTRFIQAHHAGIKKIAHDAGHGVLVSLSYDRSIAVWRVGGPHGLEEIARSALPNTVWARAAAVLADGRIATGTFGATYAVFDPQSSLWDLEGVAAGTAINSILSLRGRVYSVGDAGVVFIDGGVLAEMGSLCNFLVAAGDHVFTGGHLGRLFDARTGAVLYEHRSPLNCGVAFTKHGTAHLAIGTYTGEILIFALGNDGRPRLDAELGVYEQAVKGLSCSDGLLFSVCASTDIAWHRIADWTLAQRLGKAHDRIANACCAIGDRRFASVGRDRTLRLWEEAGSEAFASPHPNSVKCIGVDEDRTVVLTGSYGGTLALFDLVHKRWGALERPTAAGISSIAWDHTRQRFLASSYDGGVYPIQP